MQHDQSEALPRSGGDMHQFGIPALVLILDAISRETGVRVAKCYLLP